MDHLKFSNKLSFNFFCCHLCLFSVCATCLVKSYLSNKGLKSSLQQWKPGVLMTGPPEFPYHFSISWSIFLHTFFCSKEWETEEYLLYSKQMNNFGIKKMKVCITFLKKTGVLAWETIRRWENVMIRVSHYYRTLRIR